MNLRKSLRPLVIAGMVMASVVGATSVRVHAQGRQINGETQESCEAQGYFWDDAKGCANTYCPPDPERGFDIGGPWETWPYNGHIFYCDGFTGEWIDGGPVRVLPGDSSTELASPSGKFAPPDQEGGSPGRGGVPAGAFSHPPKRAAE